MVPPWGGELSSVLIFQASLPIGSSSGEHGKSFLALGKLFPTGGPHGELSPCGLQVRGVEGVIPPSRVSSWVLSAPSVVWHRLMPAGESYPWVRDEGLH